MKDEMMDCPHCGKSFSSGGLVEDDAAGADSPMESSAGDDGSEGGQMDDMMDEEQMKKMKRQKFADSLRRLKGGY